MLKSNPAKNIKALAGVLSDTVDFVARPRGIIVTAAGAIVFVNDDDTTTTFPSGGLVAGIVHPISPKRINATNTTATIYGVY